MSKPSPKTPTANLLALKVQGRPITSWLEDIAVYLTDNPNIRRLGWVTGLTHGGLPAVSVWHPQLLLHFEEELTKTWGNLDYVESCVIWLLLGNDKTWSTATLVKALGDLIGRTALSRTVPWFRTVLMADQHGKQTNENPSASPTTTGTTGAQMDTASLPVESKYTKK